MVKKTKVNVIQPEKPEDEIVFDVLAESIVKISEGMQKLDKSRLTFQALIILLQHSTKLSRNSIADVLNAMGSLEKTYLKPKKKV